jgi:predicted ArsR family transcriptional regulator
MTFDEKVALIEKTRYREFAARAAELSALEAKFGTGVGRTVLRARGAMVEGEWRRIAETYPERGVQGLIDRYWKTLEDSGYRFTCERIDKGAKFRVSYCPLAAMARELGYAKWGYACYCADEFNAVKGFDPAIAFTRTKTLMQGDDCCDQSYSEPR